jgi:hypothetical protein
MTDAAWIARVIAAAEPLEDHPAVSAISFDYFADVLRFVRFLGIRDEYSGRPLWKELKCQARGDARLMSGLCSQGENLAGAYTMSVCREYDGRRYARLCWWLGPPEQADWMQRKAEALLGQYRDTLAKRGEFPVSQA